MNYLRRQQGQDIVEYALVLPLLILLLFGIVEFGFLFLTYNTVANAAREGARAGVIPSTSDAEIEAAARNLATGLDPAELTITIQRPSSNTVRVTTTYTASLLTGPLLGGSGTITLQSAATMNSE